MSKNQNFWQSVATIGKNILAHVNISYDGAKGSLHIDIIPAEQQAIVVDGERMKIEQTAEPKALPEHAVRAEPENQNRGSDEGNCDNPSNTESPADESQ